MTSPPRLRPAVRVVLLDPEDRVLLVRWRFPARDVWGTPGGGIDPGETRADAVRRELREETGLDLPADGVGGPVAHRVHVMPFGDYDGQEEWFHLARVDAFEPRGHLSDEELRAEHLHELRWCTLPQVRALTRPTASPPVVTAPRDLAVLVERLVTDGVPAEPLELQV